MLNPWIELLATRPQLLAEHAAAWAELLAAEGGAAITGWRRRLWLQLGAALAAAMGLMLAAVALMLWAVTPASQLPQPLAGAILVGVPLLMLMLAAACYAAARPGSDGSAAARLARQWHADMALMQSTPGTP